MSALVCIMVCWCCKSLTRWSVPEPQYCLTLLVHDIAKPGSSFEFFYYQGSFIWMSILCVCVGHVEARCWRMVHSAGFGLWIISHFLSRKAHIVDQDVCLCGWDGQTRCAKRSTKNLCWKERCCCYWFGTGIVLGTLGPTCTTQVFSSRRRGDLPFYLSPSSLLLKTRAPFYETPLSMLLLCVFLTKILDSNFAIC